MIHLYTIVTDLLKRTGNQQLKKKHLGKSLGGKRNEIKSQLCVRLPRNERPDQTPSISKFVVTPLDDSFIEFIFKIGNVNDESKSKRSTAEC